MAEIFISYRRQDSKQIVASIYNFVAEAFGPETVFFPGSLYTLQVIEQNVRSAKIMLVLIGKDWFGSKADGTKRIDEQDDAVRAEVRMGLEYARQGRLAVIPILLNDTPMPTAQQLPSDLADLAEQNAERIRSDSQYFLDDINRLLNAIDERGVSRRLRGLIVSAPERMQYNPILGLVLSPSQPAPQPMYSTPVARVYPTYPMGASKPPLQVAPQKRKAKLSDLETIGIGLFILAVAFFLPTQTSMCTTDQFGQQYCQVTIYTYNGIDASLVRTLLFIAAFICIGIGIYILRRIRSE
jgi:hypothetical protein